MTKDPTEQTFFYLYNKTLHRYMARPSEERYTRKGANAFGYKKAGTAKSQIKLFEQRGIPGPYEVHEFRMTRVGNQETFTRIPA